MQVVVVADQANPMIMTIVKVKSVVPLEKVAVKTAMTKKVKMINLALLVLGVNSLTAFNSIFEQKLSFNESFLFYIVASRLKKN